MALGDIANNASTETENQAITGSTETENQVNDNTDDNNVNSTKENDEDGKPINQEAVQKKIDKVVFQKHEALRAKEAADLENAQLKARLAELEKKAPIEIPPMPEAFDPEFDTKVAERDKAIQAKAKAEAAEEAIKRAEEEQQQQFEQNRLNSIQTNVKRMRDQGKKMGMSDDDMNQADSRVAMFIKNPDVANFILNQENSMAIITKLAASVTELEKVGSMDAPSAAVYIATKVAPEAVKMRQTADLPEPFDILSGKTHPNTDPFLDGVTME